MPLASVVLPAPRLPIRSTTARAGSRAAMRRPNSMVSSADRVLKTLTKGPRQIVQQIRGEIAGELRGHARDHSRQDVAAAALGHGGRAAGVDPNPPIRQSDQRAMPFEHDAAVAASGEISRGG